MKQFESRAPGLPSISLCMIVRDEEHLLGDCLHFAAQVADEMLIVDTGSMDKTVAIAERAGAKVIPYEWDDDFSAARNFALSKATGEFVLILDADERFGPGAIDHLRRLVVEDTQRDKPTVYLPVIEHVDGEGVLIGTEHQTRIWRRSLALQYKGRVYENLCFDGRDVDRVFVEEIRIIHLGRDMQLSALKDIRSRNIRLLEMERSENGNEPRIRYALARELIAQNDYTSALPIFTDLAREDLENGLKLSAYFFASGCLRAIGDAKAAMEMALEGAEIAPDYGELWFAAGVAALHRNQRIRAEAAFIKAKNILEMDGDPPFRDPSIVEWRADIGRVQALMALREFKQAAEIIEDILPRMPERESLETQLDLARAWISVSKLENAWALIEPLIDPYTAEATPYLVAMLNAYLHLAGPQDAYDFCRGCVANHPRIIEEPMMVEAILELAEMVDDEDTIFDCLRLAIEHGTENREHYVRLARAYVERGQLDEAREIAERGRELPDSNESAKKQ